MASLSTRERMKLMQQLLAFEEKVDASAKTYSYAILLRMIRALKRRATVQRAGDISSIQKLQQVIQEESKPFSRESKKQDNSDIVYFQWFIQLLDYMRALKRNFDAKIHQQLNRKFKYACALTPVSSPGSPANQTQNRQVSIFDSNPMIKGRLARRKSTMFLLSNQEQLSTEITKMVHKELQSISNSNENDEIVYVENAINQLRFHWNELLNGECEFKDQLRYCDGRTDPTLPRDLAPLPLLLPAILSDCHQAATLTRRWISLDVHRNEDLHGQLTRIKEDYRIMKQKLDGVEAAIRSEEQRLGAEESELELLLQREQRAEEIQTLLFHTNQDIESLQQELARATTNGEILEGHTRSSTYSVERQSFGFQVEENRLQQCALQQRLQGKAYHRKLLESDLDIELQLKPALVRFTNHAQEQLENLEESLEGKRRQRNVFREVLKPLQMRRQELEQEILSQAMTQPELVNNSISVSNIPKTSLESEASYLDTGYSTGTPSSHTLEVGSVNTEQWQPVRSVFLTDTTDPVQPPEPSLFRPTGLPRLPDRFSPRQMRGSLSEVLPSPPFSEDSVTTSMRRRSSQRPAPAQTPHRHARSPALNTVDMSAQINF